MRLSLSMITKDEEANLAGCLESVRGLVDEIIIVDTGSSDRTKEVALAYGAKVFDFEWIDDFSAARNESLSHTTGDWVLYLDADERIDRSFHQKIRKLISSGKADAYLLNLRSKIGTRDDAQYHIAPYPRLFRKIKGVYFVGAVHEQITTRLVAVNARIRPTDIIIEHLGYAQADEILKEKANRNYALLMKQLETGVNKGYVLYQIGQTEIMLGRIDDGFDKLEQALAVGGFGKSVEANIHSILADLHLRKGKLDRALEECERSLEDAPGQSFAHIVKGEIYTKKGDYQKALTSYEEALKKYVSGEVQKIVQTAIEPIFEISVIYSKLARTYHKLGDLEHAHEFYKRSLSGLPSEQRIQHYLEFLIEEHDYGKILEVVREYPQYSNRDWLLRIAAAACMELEMYNEASNMLRKISNPDYDVLVSLAKSLMKLRDFSSAVAAFERAFVTKDPDVESLEMFGLAQIMTGKFSSAVLTLSKVLEMSPENFRAARFLETARQKIAS
ncbi:MAG: tetratricopeptide repeat-containing glycosyltransferase family 2 protein [Candidatus Kryptoniota bacterium]